MGTTTACYYASLHGPASLILAEEVVTHGQRALVGKVNMNSCPDTDYCETGDNSLRDTEKFIEEVQNIGVSIFIECSRQNKGLQIFFSNFTEPLSNTYNHT